MQSFHGRKIDTYGNPDIFQRHKTAFLCSRRYPAGAVLRIYDWAREMRDNGECVVSGFHSALERDVLQLLLRGEQPLILVTARLAETLSSRGAACD